MLHFEHVAEGRGCGGFAGHSAAAWTAGCSRGEGCPGLAPEGPGPRRFRLPASSPFLPVLSTGPLCLPPVVVAVAALRRGLLFWSCPVCGNFTESKS